MNILSLFDGISCGRVALDRAGIAVGKYYAAEIDKYAIRVSEKNYPDIIRLGDVLNWQNWKIDWASIDMVFAGFPCQAWSVAGKQLGDKDERGMLFWTMLDIIQHVQLHNPSVKYLIENVKMKKEFEEYITYHTQQALGEVHKVLINSKSVVPQSRGRFYWTSNPVTQPSQSVKRYTNIKEIEDNYIPARMTSSKGDGVRVIRDSGGVFGCLTATMFKGVVAAGRPFLVHPDDIGSVYKNGVTRLRKLTPVECERLQTLPDNYTAGVSNTQRYKAIGNGWTVDVIAHILKSSY